MWPCIYVIKEKNKQQKKKPQTFKCRADETHLPAAAVGKPPGLQPLVPQCEGTLCDERECRPGPHGHCTARARFRGVLCVSGVHVYVRTRHALRGSQDGKNPGSPRNAIPWGVAEGTAGTEE